MKADDDWNIPAGLRPCPECVTPPGPGDSVTTVLRLGPDGPVREDLCASCRRPVDGDDAVYFWRHRLPEAAERRLVVDYHVLREIFTRLLDRPEAEYGRLAYLVGLVLLRKRLLRLRAFEARGDREVMVVTRGAGQPDLVVPAPHLSPEALVETRDRLVGLLNADLPDDLELDLEALALGEARGGDPDGDPAGAEGR